MVVATGAANSDRITTTTTDHHQKHFSDIYIRTSWIDARIALEQIEKVKKKNINDFITSFKIKSLN